MFCLNSDSNNSPKPMMIAHSLPHQIVDYQMKVAKCQFRKIIRILLFPENDFNSTSIDFDHRREFVERHAELLRMKLKNCGELMEMMGKWAGINHFGEGENDCQKVINILVDPNQPANSFESFCLALIISRQFRIFRQIRANWSFSFQFQFSIFYELANLDWMEKCWKHFIENGQKEEEQKEEEIGEWMMDEDSHEIRVENVDSAGGDGTFFDMMAYYRKNRNEVIKLNEVMVW